MASDAVSISLGYAVWCSIVHSIAGSVPLNNFSKSSIVIFQNRTVSTMHAMIMFTLSAYYFLRLNPAINIDGGMTAYETSSISVMIGYLIYDTLFELTTGRQTDTIVHHAMGFVSHVSTLIYGCGPASVYTMMVFLAEGSTPALNISWLMHQLGMKDTALFKLCVFCLVILFFVWRILLSPFLSWHLITHGASWMHTYPGPFWLNCVITIAFVVLNGYWFLKLLSMAFGKAKV